MAQTPKGRLVQGLYKPIHGTCAMYFYLGVPSLKMDALNTYWFPFGMAYFQGLLLLVSGSVTFYTLEN